MRIRPLLPLTGALFAPLAGAQTLIPLAPFSNTGDLYVSDSTNDAVYRLQDLDLDGDYDGPAEVSVFYDDVTGSLALTNPNGIAVGTNGTVYLGDSSEDVIFALIDLDQNGDCFGPGEATVFYDETVSATGIVLGSPANLCVDFQGNLWLAVAGSGSGAEFDDKIVRLTDLNLDGDANDVGESVEYYVFPQPGGSGGEAIPQDAQIGLDGRLYVIDVPSSGSNPKGVYRLDDVDASGDIQPGEIQPFFTPVSQPNNPFFWGLTMDAEGYFYMADTLNELVWRFRDENFDGVVDEATEATVWWQATSSLIWRVAAASDGSIYAAESQAPDRVLRLFDADNDGVVDPVTETQAVWSEDFGNLDIANPRTLAFGRGATVQVPNTVSIGSSFNVNTFGTTGQGTITYASAATIPGIVLPPFGSFELDPSLAFTFVGGGIVPLVGPSQIPINVPAAPALVGATVFVQSAVGSGGALRLSNVDSVTFQ